MNRASLDFLVRRWRWYRTLRELGIGTAVAGVVMGLVFPFHPLIAAVLGIATAAAITRSAAASPRDKARAAELLISAAFRQKQHLVHVARVEHDIMAAEAQNAAEAVVEAALNDILSPPAPGDQATTTPGRSKPSPKARRTKRA